MSEPGILPEPIPFGKYYLLERINVGGMAEVYKAKAFGVEGFERLLAIKKILDNIAEDESFIEMFIDEAKIAGQLHHPNIAQIFDLGQVDGSYFIALEYISGKDLKTKFERGRRIGEEVSIPRICYVIMKVCEGLGHAHEKTDPQGNNLGIVHRDVSPQNILCSYEGEVKIIDFGIAKAQGKTSQTQVGILKGKFSYMSPEQVRGLHVDHRSDIFSLGIVMYEMLTLERLFLGESDFDTLEKIRKVEMSPPSLYNPHIPKELEDIVLKALARTPEDRYQSTHELAEDLERFMRNEGYYYTNKDLADYMKEAFKADIEFENKKLEYYRSLDLQPIDEADGEDDEELMWDEEEMETQIFDREDEDGGDVEESITDSDIVYAEDIEASPARPAADGPDVVYPEGADPVAGDGVGDNEVTQIHVPGAGGDADSEPELDVEDPDPTKEFDRMDVELDLESERPDDGIEIEPRNEPENTARVKALDSQQRSGVKVPSSRVQTDGSSGSGGAMRAVRIIVAAAFVSAAGFGVWWFVINTTAEVTFDFGDEPVTITANGEVIHEGETPVTRELSYGDVDLVVEREGSQPLEITRSLERGEQVAVEEQLQPLDYSDTGVDVETTPEGATVYVDGEEFEETTPASVRDLESGAYEIRVELEDYLESSEEVQIEHDEVADLSWELDPAEFELTVSSSPSRADFTVYDEDDEEIESGDTPETLEGLDAESNYRVVVERSRYESYEETVEPLGEAEVEIEAELERSEEPVAANTDPDPTPQPDPTPDPDPTPEPDPEPDPQPDPDPEPEPEPDPQPSGTGTVSIMSVPAARVVINGEDTGQYTPMRGHELPAGRHEIELVNEDHNLSKKYYVDLEDGDSERIINR